MATLHIATATEFRALLLTAWGLYENQIEVDKMESDDDSLPDYVSPVQEDRLAVTHALENELDQGLAFPATLNLDPMFSAEQKLELLNMLEQVQEQGAEWQDALDDAEQDPGAAFTAHIEGYDGNPQS